MTRRLRPCFWRNGDQSSSKEENRVSIVSSVSKTFCRRVCHNAVSQFAGARRSACGARLRRLREGGAQSLRPRTRATSPCPRRNPTQPPRRCHQAASPGSSPAPLSQDQGTKFKISMESVRSKAASSKGSCWPRRLELHLRRFMARPCDRDVSLRTVDADEATCGRGSSNVGRQSFSHPDPTSKTASPSIAPASCTAPARDGRSISP